MRARTATIAARTTAGVVGLALAIGLGAAVDYLSDLGMAEVGRVGEQGMVASAGLREAERGVQVGQCG